MTDRSNDFLDRFKETEVGPLPVSWQAATLGSVAKKEKFAVVDGPFGSQLKVSEFVDSGIPLIEMLHIKDDRFNGEIRRFITAEKFEDIKRSSVKGGDIILSKTGTLGLVALLAGHLEVGIITSRLAKISIDTAKAHPPYAYFALLWLRGTGYWDRVGEGSTMKVLNLRKIRDAAIPLPPLSEQRGIAHVLSTIQRAIQAQDKVIAAAKELKRSLMQRLFTYGPGPEPAATKETEIGEIPEHWQVVPLGDVALEVYRYPTYYGIDYTTDGVPEIRGELIRENGQVETDMHQFRFIAPDTSARFPRTVLRGGDFVMSVRGTIGKVALIPERLAGANITANLVRISLDPARCYPPFYKHHFVSQRFHHAMGPLSSQTTIRTLQASLLRSMGVPLPPRSEQKDIADILSVVDGKVQAEANRGMALRELFQSVLHYLMTGQVRVKEIEG